jgi:hypothetical protein
MASENAPEHRKLIDYDHAFEEAWNSKGIEAAERGLAREGLGLLTLEVTRYLSVERRLRIRAQTIRQ